MGKNTKKKPISTEPDNEKRIRERLNMNRREFVRYCTEKSVQAAVMPSILHQMLASKHAFGQINMSGWVPRVAVHWSGGWGVQRWMA